MKRKIIFYSLIAGLTIPVCAAAVILAKKMSREVVKANAERTVTITSDDFALSDLTTSYQQLIVQELDGKDAPVMNYFLAKKDANDKLVLAPSGRIYNYDAEAAYSGRITNLVSMRVVYTGGTLFIQEGIGGEAETYGPKESFGSDVLHSFTTSPNHFMISNSGAETTITSISYTFTCEEAGYTLERLGDTYNGKGSDGNVYTMVRTGDTLLINGAVPGIINVDNAGNFTIVIDALNATYTGKVSADYRTLEFATCTGNGPEFTELNRVYVVDDFESYADRGTGFTAEQTSIFTASNLRGAYWVDCGSGSGATWVSGSGFKMPSTGNYLNLCTTAEVVHGGSKSMLLQGQKAGWVRLWNSDVWNQQQHFNFGRGDRLSFWIYSGRNNPDGTGTNASNVKIKAQVYYQNFVLTDSNRNSSTYGTGIVDVNDKVISSGTGWQEVVISLDPNKVVKGFNIMINNSGLSTDYVFMPIDDITVSTTPVFERTRTYDESATRITRTYHTTATVASQSVTVKLALGADGFVQAYAGGDMEAQSYSIDGDQITIVTTGEYSGLTYGNWTGTLSNDKSTITIDKATGITGTIKQYISDSTIVFHENEVLLDGTEGSIANVEQKALRQYYEKVSSDPDVYKWTTDSSNTDRFTFTNKYHVEGNNAVKVRPYSSANMRIIMNPSVVAERTQDFDTVAFWVYAPAGTKYTISIYAYKTTDATGTYQQCIQRVYSDTDGTADGLSGWHFVESGLYNSTGFGKSFAITINTNTNATILDYVTYF